MKKILFIAIAILMLAHPTNAQVKFGIQGGLNINKFVIDTSVIDTNNQAGFYVGPTFFITLANFDIEASGIYDVRSLEVDGETVRRQNLDLQANIRKGVEIVSGTSIFAFAGPQFAFNIGAKNIGEVTDCVKDWRWKDSDFSFNLGGGVRINNIEVRVNYNTAFGKTAEANEILPSNVLSNIEEFKLEPKSNAWQIGLTYIF